MKHGRRKREWKLKRRELARSWFSGPFGMPMRNPTRRTWEFRAAAQKGEANE